MCVCCFYTVFRDQLWKDVVNQSLVFGCTESRRDQEEGSELDSHEELDNHLRICGSRRDQEQGGGAGPSREPRRDQEQGGGAGLRQLDLSFASVVPQQQPCYGRCLWFNNSLRPRKPEGSLGRTAQDGHLDSHTAPELWSRLASVPGDVKQHCILRRLKE